MIYKNITQGRFISRPNRFIAHSMINGQTEVCHVKNTGRCRELLTENAKIILEISDNPLRKTKYDLIAVYKGNRLINIDSQAPNKVVYEYLKEHFEDRYFIKPEYSIGNSRIDFYMENSKNKILIEVKGCTLENNNIVSFPDAPTERGTKHIKELISLKKEGYITALLFVIQMENPDYFIPNSLNDPVFAETLKKAHAEGVYIGAMDCFVTENSLKLKQNVKFII